MTITSSLTLLVTFCERSTWYQWVCRGWGGGGRGWGGWHLSKPKKRGKPSLESNSSWTLKRSRTIVDDDLKSGRIVILRASVTSFCAVPTNWTPVAGYSFTFNKAAVGCGPFSGTFKSVMYKCGCFMQIRAGYSPTESFYFCFRFLTSRNTLSLTKSVENFHDQLLG